jgi:hypothetical protein
MALNSNVTAISDWTCCYKFQSLTLQSGTEILVLENNSVKTGVDHNFQLLF